MLTSPSAAAANRVSRLGCESRRCCIERRSVISRSASILSMKRLLLIANSLPGNDRQHDVSSVPAAEVYGVGLAKDLRGPIDRIVVQERSASSHRVLQVRKKGQFAVVLVVLY